MMYCMRGETTGEVSLVEDASVSATLLRSARERKRKLTAPTLRISISGGERIEMLRKRSEATVR